MLNSYYFLSVAQQPNSNLERLIAEICSSHSISHTPLNEWSACRRGRYVYNKQQTQKTYFHIVSGIRTRDP